MGLPVWESECACPDGFLFEISHVVVWREDRCAYFRGQSRANGLPFLLKALRERNSSWGKQSQTICWDEILASLLAHLKPNNTTPSASLCRRQDFLVKQMYARWELKVSILEKRCILIYMWPKAKRLHYHSFVETFTSWKLPFLIREIWWKSLGFYTYCCRSDLKGYKWQIQQLHT